MAHYDPDGEVAPHVQYCIEALRPLADEFVVVTTAELTDEAREWLESKVRLVSRPNRGFDFCSYQCGINASKISAFSELVLLNDGFVFPLKPIDEIFGSMERSVATFWGLTQSRQFGPHIQSFFMVFRSAVIHSRPFTQFWQDIQEVDDKWRLSMTHELGLSKTLLDAGFLMDSFFREDWLDRLDIMARGLRSTLKSHGREAALKFAIGLLQPGATVWNPYLTLADRVLDGGRLPFVKLSVLREDPDRLDTGYLLQACEERFPTAFRGVREYLLRTGTPYGDRWVRTWKASPLSPHFRPPGILRGIVRAIAAKSPIRASANQDPSRRSQGSA